MVHRRVVRPVRPVRSDRHDGLAYTLWRDQQAPAHRGLLVLHGADSQKESHHDFARVALAAGHTVIAFDQRGHGASEGPMGGGAIDDIVSMGRLLREELPPGGAVTLRGSSMGGMLAILAAGACRAAAVIAIAPAAVQDFRRGLMGGRFGFAADLPALEALLSVTDLPGAVAELAAPILIMHAEGDERVPVNHSRELAASFSRPDSRLIVASGGHHRSVQHDEELQAVALRWLDSVLAS